MDIHVPGDDRGSISPDGGPVLAPFILCTVKFRLCLLYPCHGQHIRHHIGNRAVLFPLLKLHILKIFPEKGRSLHMVGGSRAEDLCISCPAAALVSLGTVCGDIQEIALLAPFRILDQAIKLFVRGLDASGLFDVRIQRPGLKVVLVCFVRFHPADLYISEAEEGKVGAHPFFLSV